MPEKEENKTVIMDFLCSEHGYIKPEPKCPKCDVVKSDSYIKCQQDLIEELEREIRASTCCNCWECGDLETILEIIKKYKTRQ